jgi:hypothetical protein
MNERSEFMTPHRFVRVAREPFEAMWPAIEEMVVAHAKEVEPEGSPRPFRLDIERMVAADRLGFIRWFTLRVDGELKGYCSWNLSWDLESEGLPIATQGAWYVGEGGPWGGAAKLFMVSLDELKKVGVQCVFPHHRLQGRGMRLGRFFQSLGAVPIQQTYMLWLGSEPSEARLGD